MTRKGIPFCACSFIGRRGAEEYYQARTDGRVRLLFPAVFFGIRSQDEGRNCKARRRSAVDDQPALCDIYQQQGARYYWDNRDWQLGDHAEELEDETTWRFEAFGAARDDCRYQRKKRGA